MRYVFLRVEESLALIVSLWSAIDLPQAKALQWSLVTGSLGLALGITLLDAGRRTLAQQRAEGSLLSRRSDQRLANGDSFHRLACLAGGEELILLLVFPIII